MENPTQTESPITQYPPQTPQIPPITASGIKKIHLLIGFVLVLIIVPGIAFFLGVGKKESSQNPEVTSTPLLPSETPTPTLTPTSTPVSTLTPTPTVKLTPTPRPTASVAPTPVGPTPTQASTNPNLKTYTSQTLGISFSYLQSQPNTNEKISIKEIGNKVYVYPSNMAANQGQYAESFTKDSADTLETAIKKQFLSSISENDCFVENTTSRYKYPSSYKVAEISYPKPDSEGPNWENAEKCPPTYSQSNGISYFLSDTNYPTTYFFFSIGQYGISSDQNKMWQETVQFLN